MMLAYRGTKRAPLMYHAVAVAQLDGPHNGVATAFDRHLAATLIRTGRGLDVTPTWHRL